ncbi:sigma 54-interacting transcriptional regulator [Vitiosangium sp. GDMCC 1.1324]|uniref:sigma 54-interacting transcriptional regulator n=1 Tax=Vitiosangium sp. (strain GDMCC 1.1324) TaxID=2138576 RepID=UPI000D3BBAA3|nr:sigma 54-interacting transcriptional regulator [Vitiosangium sp. GDMCC 1.1324]PTL80443.1 sigma-54-dependent Fis family transcriptional regulator [Vitiosangium sp. GDMCC 1.1324]
MPELVFFRRGEEVLRVGLGLERMVLGRGEKSDVVIPDPEVSRQQAALVFDGEQCTLEDLSGKGTQVAGSSMSKGVLADGSDIALGQWRAVFRLHGSGQSEVPTEVGSRTALQPRDSTSRWQPAQVRIKQGADETVHKLGSDTDSFTVGKDPSCDLVVQDPFISGRHLKVTRRDGHFHVVDTNSTNGTWMGSVRVYEVQVGLPTTLRLGETDLILEPVTPTRKDLSFHGIIGGDPSVRQLNELIERVAPSSAAVAILGESGTGKELVARAIHECSQRGDKPFIPVNCAAISKELIESELFGHEKGSFTGATNARKGAFEEADGGTLFLDEIGELPLDLQAKLLRALESGEIKRVGASRPTHVDVRVVAATNRDLLSAAREGRFREDLYYRLCVVPLHLPPLRNRRGDILSLAEHFLRTYSPRGQTVRLTPTAVDRLQQHTWPGNIRELRNVVHRALLLRKGPNIEPTDISFDQEVNRETGVAVPELPPGMTLEQMLLKLERQIVEAALRRYNNNRERVARELGVARSTLFKRLKEWGLTKQEEEAE